MPTFHQKPNAPAGKQSAPARPARRVQPPVPEQESPLVLLQQTLGNQATLDLAGARTAGPSGRRERRPDETDLDLPDEERETRAEAALAVETTTAPHTAPPAATPRPTRAPAPQGLPDHAPSAPAPRVTAPSPTPASVADHAPRPITHPPVPADRMPSAGRPPDADVSPTSGPEQATAAQTHTGAAATPPLLTEDRATDTEAGQMEKTPFLGELRMSVERTAADVLAGTRWSAEGCPWIEYWFAYYEGRDAEHVERVIHRYAPETLSAETAADYIPMITARVRRSISTWAATGRIEGVPEGVPLSLLVQRGEGGSRPEGPPLLFKSRAGGAHAEGHPRAVQAQLGEGQALDNGVRSRLESACRVDLSGVRVHTDPDAARLAGRMNARAFTVGEDVAFGSGEYRPGTPIGDALIAHEVAHVVQQGRGRGTQEDMRSESPALEKDADQFAAGAVAALWTGAREGAMPRGRSGLALQRCGTSVTFPSYSEIVADADVQTRTDAAWANTEAAANAAGRREEGFWIRLNTGTQAYEFTATVTGDVVGPGAGATIGLGSRPADTPGANGTTYTVASFHTHTPTAFRTVPRVVGPSGADQTADNHDDVAGVVYDYVESPAGSGSIPAGHPIGSAAQRYHSGPDRRQNV
ncbi:MAG: DUF4157 domain-containing protein [Acidobacteria bacterium]|nr:DUF4157 domain-containing protein [Acidobacteriota bacterium]